MARLDYTRTGSWRLLPTPARLDFTRSGAWRVLPSEVAEVFAAEDGETAALAGACHPGSPARTRDSGGPSAALEVWDIDPAKWDEFAPLFQRS